jgi:peptidoglycan/xylan/chitin deacetylase (PgdA/CDA1 family)
MQLALKIDVDTFRGTREGVPNLVDILTRHQAGATFLFSLGPDHTGRAIKRALRPGFMKKVRRTSVVEHYGYKTLMYGTLLPGPDIGRECAETMKMVAGAEFEVGIHCWDHVRWQDHVAGETAIWTEQEMRRAVQRYEDIFGEAPHVHGAAGWQMNVHALRLEQRLGFAYASDTRGTHPFMPVYRAEIIACPQIPTTLPTLDELIGLDGIDATNVADHLLRLTQEQPAPQGHVFTLHAELEGMKFAPILEQLLEGWKAQGHELVSMQQYCRKLEPTKLPRHEVIFGEMPGRTGILALQGPRFLAE